MKSLLDEKQFMKSILRRYCEDAQLSHYPKFSLLSPFSRDFVEKSIREQARLDLPLSQFRGRLPIDELHKRLVDYEIPSDKILGEFVEIGGILGYKGSFFERNKKMVHHQYHSPNPSYVYLQLVNTDNQITERIAPHGNYKNHFKITRTKGLPKAPLKTFDFVSGRYDYEDGFLQIISFTHFNIESIENNLQEYDRVVLWHTRPLGGSIPSIGDIDHACNILDKRNKPNSPKVYTAIYKPSEDEVYWYDYKRLKKK